MAKKKTPEQIVIFEVTIKGKDISKVEIKRIVRDG